MVRRYGVCVMASLAALVATTTKAQQPPQFAQDRMGGFAAVRFPVVSPLAKPHPLPTPAAPVAAQPHASPFIPTAALPSDPATPATNGVAAHPPAPAAGATEDSTPRSPRRKEGMLPYCK